MELLILTLGTVGGIAGVLVYSSDRVQMRLRFREFKVADLAKLPENRRAKIVGTVVNAPHTLLSPLTRRQCVCYQIIADTYGGQVIHEFYAVPFFVDDGTGRALVDPARGVVRVIKSHERRLTLDETGTENEREFLARYGLGEIHPGGYRFREGIIEAGDVVEVIGAGVHEPDPEAVGTERGYRDLPTMRLRLMHSARNPLLIRHAPENRLALPPGTHD